MQNFFLTTEIFGFKLYEILSYFLIYGVIGWIFESIVVSRNEGRFVNRGFLYGPFIPIYSFGVTGFILCMEPLNQLMSLPLTFSFLPAGSQLVPVRYKFFLMVIAGALIASVLEYFVSWLMEKLFNARWWDYSDHRFNIKGRISLGISVLWGLLSIIAVRFIHPFVVQLPFSYVKPEVAVILMEIGFIILLVDVIFSVIAAAKLSEKIKVLGMIKTELTELVTQSKAYSNVEEMRVKIENSKVSEGLKEFSAKLSAQSDKSRESLQMTYARLKESYAKSTERFTGGEKRFFKAFPNLKDSKGYKLLDEIRDKITIDEVPEETSEKEQETADIK